MEVLLPPPASLYIAITPVTVVSYFYMKTINRVKYLYAARDGQSSYAVCFISKKTTDSQIKKMINELNDNLDIMKLLMI